IRKDLPGTGPSTDRLQNALAAGNIFDLMEAREPLECKSCRLAAERAEEPRIKAMEAALQKARAAADDDYPAFLDADLQFHYALAEATHNAVICEMMKLLIEKVLAHHSRLRTRYLSANFRAFSIDTAARVIDCVRAGDGDGAAGWMRQHLNAINPELKTLIPNGRDGNSSDR
ncbi:MAG: FCD domain-containing protein, partial [Desulfobacteraceae bacterium]|nr:FCD domain-containing protein [Desulfobacteraceae bacterium]